MYQSVRLSSMFNWLPLGLLACLIACSNQTHLPVDAHPSDSTSTQPTSASVAAGNLPLKVVADVPLTGGTTRLDYQSRTARAADSTSPISAQT